MMWPRSAGEQLHGHGAVKAGQSTQHEQQAPHVTEPSSQGARKDTQLHITQVHTGRTCLRVRKHAR
eukprot:CAMPEP_0202883432 /NCGR_PEP_ID=MMETSP1391-20130828/39436_1 /ASSEMBLY_ACC=CAM_ASM_000867 /TAXON_ID=1034604 /ORGANISM="Chlamydomonas leiostraca, Strain SAG 11-49" /LENGTH=65 /DNA_ID=CAMNT_0049566441 /DNA_START=72 /DNA_END=266 /DNA_ORIENTATION=-